MGQFKIEIVAVGGHGCQREVKDGGKVSGCGFYACPDCKARRLVDEMQRAGMTVEAAIFTHWPGESSEVVDDLVSKVRNGNFG